MEKNHEIKKYNDDIYLEKYIEEQRIYKNKNEFLTYEIEYRRDPITGLYNIINTGTKNKPRNYPEENINKTYCPFCKENIFNETPVFEEFPKEIDFKGKIMTDKFDRMILFNSILVPNLYPYYSNHLLMIPNYNEHIENFKDLNIIDLINGFLLIKRYIEYINQKYNKNLFIYVNLNKGFFSGASQSHIHFQILISDIPTNYHKILLDKSEEYFKKYNKFFLEDYYKFEDSLNERVIYKFKYSYWYSSFSPFRNNEIFSVINSFGIFFLHDEGLKEFVEELYKILVIYEKLYHNFNMTIYDTTLLKDKPVLPLIRIAQRNKYDMGYLEALNLENSVSSLPEETAKQIRNELKD